jgi:hypothetical protein
MRAYAPTSIFLFVFVRGEWHSKTKNINLSRPALSPHPNPLPVGEGISFLPSPTGRRVGDEGLRAHLYFFCLCS